MPPIKINPDSVAAMAASVAGCVKSLVDAVRNGTEPTYGPLQGRLDQELILAIRQSAADGGRPIRLPLENQG